MENLTTAEEARQFSDNAMTDDEIATLTRLVNEGVRTPAATKIRTLALLCKQEHLGQCMRLLMGVGYTVTSTGQHPFSGWGQGIKVTW